MSRRSYTIARITQRDVEIAMAFNAAGSVPLPACKCRRSTSAKSATWIGGVRTDIRYMAVVVCNMCRGYRPLGPSDETPVAVEVRAAELADLATSHADSMESSGWSAVSYDSEPLDDPRWHAGWLGRVIYDERREERLSAAINKESTP